MCLPGWSQVTQKWPLLVYYYPLVKWPSPLYILARGSPGGPVYIGLAVLAGQAFTGWFISKCNLNCWTPHFSTGPWHFDSNTSPIFANSGQSPALAKAWLSAERECPVIVGSESEWKAIHLFAWSTFSESANSSTFHFFPKYIKPESSVKKKGPKIMTLLWIKFFSLQFLRFQNQIFNMVLGLAPEPSKWVSVYFPVSWLTQVHTTIKVLDTIAVRFWSSSWPVWPWFSDNSGWANPALPRPEDRGRYRNHQPCLDFWILWIYGDTNYIIMLQCSIAA